MDYIVETKTQLDYLENRGYKEAFIKVIPCDPFSNPASGLEISLIYIKPLDGKAVMLGLSHSETYSLNGEDVINYLKTFDVLYCLDKKELLHYYPLGSLKDLFLPPKTYKEPENSVFSHFYRKKSLYSRVNYLIPLSKHYEHCENIYEEINETFTQQKDEYYEFYQRRIPQVFAAIERNGLRVDSRLFEEFFHPTESNMVYTQYNCKTLTGRPSNRFRGVNYAALNKENGCRQAFIPRNDELVEMDISAYHPTLVGKLVDYTFDDLDIHNSFAKMYGVSYAKSKELTFKQLYGGVFKQYENLEFFKKVQTYIKNIWTDFNSKGYVKVPVSNYKLKKFELTDMNPQKLFNYILQGLETATNVVILFDILKELRGCKTKLVLYTYDSFLFDVDKNELDKLKRIEKIITDHKLKIKVKSGISYNFA